MTFDVMSSQYDNPVPSTSQPDGAISKDHIITMLNHRISELLTTIKQLSEKLDEQNRTIQLLTANRDAKMILDNDDFSSSNETTASPPPAPSQKRKKVKKASKNKSKAQSLQDPPTSNRFSVLQEVTSITSQEDTVTQMDVESSQAKLATTSKTKPSVMTPSNVEAYTQDEAPSQQKPSGNPETDPEDTRRYVEKAPPIVIRAKEKWIQVNTLFTNNHIQITKAKTINDGIRVQTPDAENFRKAIKTLNQHKIEYHTWQLPSEKLLHVVLRGVPEPVEPELIRTELEEQGFHPKSVVRMRKRNNIPMPLVLVTLPKDEKKIFEIDSIAYVKITVESQHQKAVINQCFNCQKFGHAQSRCTATPRCVYCAGNHHTYECKKEATSKKCCNCGEEHTSSYRGCTAWPKLKTTSTTTTRNQAVPKARTYADAAKQTDQDSATPTTFTQLFEKFNNMYQQMQGIALQLGKMFEAKTN